MHILLIESNRSNQISFLKDLVEHNFKVDQTSTGNSGLKKIEGSQNYELIIINAASLRTNGTRTVKTYKRDYPDIPLILIISEDVELKDFFEANIVLQLPFTFQKLFNRVQLFKPTEKKFLLITGPLTLNTQTNLVSCNGNETQLTPRLSRLLKYFMDRPGKIIEREKLFKNVWETDYLGDTRTLDVHISWLRKAIEVDSRKPKLIRTIRSSGYQLDIH
jgi:DNA-binding response OmpR family regulator